MTASSTTELVTAELLSDLDQAILREKDEEVLELMHDFLRMFPHRIDQTLAAYEAGNADELERRVHQLKGSTGLYGFRKISEVLEAMEVQLRRGGLQDSLKLPVRILAGLARSLRDEPPENRAMAQPADCSSS